ncbi:MAG: fatty acid desaturase [Chloroflexi bacterium]|nr:fatty acid desaturase [Chloroflexota bacterium]
MTITDNMAARPSGPAGVAKAPEFEPNEYAQLRDLVKNAGLLEKDPGHYAIKLAVNLGLLALSIGILTLVDSLWIQMLNAAFLAFIMVQLCFLGHDLGHKQVFRSSRNNDLLGLFVSFLVGINRTWWVEKHNEHHSNPNDLDLDPDINLPFVAFSEEQAQRMKGIFRLIASHQAILFYPLVCFEGFVLKVSGIQYLFGNKLRFPVAEPLLMAAHVGLYIGLVFMFLPVWQGFLFLAVNQLLLGLYIGSTFAPNHKGMLLLDGTSPLDYLRKQVLTSRNIKSSRLNDYLYGGLNYQIEHHLFPNMPRNRLKEAQKIVMPFCRGRSISYYETGIVRSHREILQHLHHVSAPLRA